MPIDLEKLSDGIQQKAQATIAQSLGSAVSDAIMFRTQAQELVRVIEAANAVEASLRERIEELEALTAGQEQRVDAAVPIA